MLNQYPETQLEGVLKVEQSIVCYVDETVRHCVMECGAPFGNCLPGTELLQSPYRTEFSMGSLSPRYRRSLRRCCDPWADRRSPMDRCRSLRNLLNIVKHSKTSWIICKTLWYFVKHCEPQVKHREPLVNHHEPLKTSWNTQTLTIRCDIGARAEFPPISALSFRWYQRLRCWCT